MLDLQMYSCVCAIHKGSWPAQKTIKYDAFNKIMVSIQGADQKTSSLEDLRVSHERRIPGPQETAMSALSDFQCLTRLALLRNFFCHGLRRARALSTPCGGKSVSRNERLPPALGVIEPESLVS